MAGYLPHYTSNPPLSEAGRPVFGAGVLFALTHAGDIVRGQRHRLCCLVMLGWARAIWVEQLEHAHGRQCITPSLRAIFVGLVLASEADVIRRSREPTCPSP